MTNQTSHDGAAAENTELEIEQNETAKTLEGELEEINAAEFESVAATEETLDVAALQQALSDAEAKAAENKEKMLMAMAETDNVRKRAARDVSNAHKYALDKFLPDLLAVKDSLELGTKAAKESVAVEENEQMTTFIEGSDMAINLFADALKKANVETVNPEGEMFNAEFHQAMTMIPNDDVPPNTILEVIQKGYVLNERLVRPAMVIVSKAS